MSFDEKKKKRKRKKKKELSQLVGLIKVKKKIKK